MKKKFIGFALFLLLVVTAVLPVCAETGDGFTSEYERLLDSAGLLTESEYNDILSQLNELSERQNFDLVVHTTANMSENYDNVVDYADDVYDYLGFGYQYGVDRDGAILVIALDTRDVYISTRGYGLTAFTDYGIEVIIEDISEYLTDGDYYTGICRFIAYSDEYLNLAHDGNPFDVLSPPLEPGVPFKMGWVIVSLAVGAIAAATTVSSMKEKLKTVRSAAAAGNYVRKDSLVLAPEKSRDIYLYTTQSRSAKPRSSSSGGSSSHSSSSGSSHGGGGGKF